MRNRNVIALSAVGIHVCIGSVYAWSVLTKPIIQELGVGLKEVQWIFSLAILFLGLSAAFLGKYVEKFGPRKSGLVSTIFFTAGMFGSALAVSLHSLPLLYLFYGVIGGIGLGVGYITPVSTLVKWFPEKRGFATGVAIMGFGFASLIAGPVIQMLLEAYDLVSCFAILGFVYLLIMLPSSLYLAPPQSSYEVIAGGGEAVPLTVSGQMTVEEAMQHWEFYALWVLFFINITCGIGLLSVASPMAQEVVKMSPLAAAAMVGIIGMVNGFGRIAWSSISDYAGRANTYIAFFLIQIIAFYLLAYVTNGALFQILIYIIISCYGGGFATMPAFLSDLFGTKQLGAIHGRILSAWAAAGVVGPYFVSFIKESTGSYSATLLVFSACFVIALILSVVIRCHPRKPAKIQTELFS